MNTHVLALQLMACQGCLGAFDTLYHHELTEALPGRASARLELSIHAVRALIYSAMFIGLSCWRFNGLWAVVLLVVFAVEIVLTLWDFVVEDKTRLLPATERVTHTVLAMNGGAFIALLALNAGEALALPTALVWEPHGALSLFLFVCGLGVGLSGIRDAFAARALARQAARADAPALRFGDAECAVLVTGATGFIGQKLVRALLADGHRVTVLTRQPRAAAWMFDARVECIGDMGALPPARRIDVVVNLAGARILGWRWSEARRAALRASRIGTTRKVVAWIAAAHHKPALMLSASAIGYYGIQAQGVDTVLTERDGPQAMFMSDLCREWEEAAYAAAAHGVRVACMRFGLVLGTQGALPMMLLPVKLGMGGPLGGGRQWLSWIHVDDLIAGMAHLWTGGEGGAWNFTAPQNLSQADFNKVAATVLKRPYWLPTPGWPMRLALGEQADLLLEGQRVAPARLQASGFAFRHPALAGALANLL
ncbi:TIGR01777 family oxidoreductase [Massilia aquatica]|uniref:TIGR01777 family protein n=1 Tax=Massilia aquatica TaxID=2609000 RepID=A0ABX0M8F3_9BURK|nr:TIGR01777 family oxidoreductase [Massilia aquatica]NHZ40687.1 TIGR01777 family protein [Massilia aquatica]